MYSWDKLVDQLYQFMSAGGSNPSIEKNSLSIPFFQSLCSNGFKLLYCRYKYFAICMVIPRTSFCRFLVEYILFLYCEWNLHCNHCFIYLNHSVIVVLQHALQANWKNSYMDIIQTIRINGGVAWPKKIRVSLIRLFSLQYCFPSVFTSRNLKIM